MDSRYWVCRTPVIPHGCWQAPRWCLLMTPGLAFFYGGMVRARGVLNMIDDEHQRHGRRHGAVGAVRLLAGLRQRRAPTSSVIRRSTSGLKGLIGGNATAAVRGSSDRAAADAVDIPLAGTLPQTVFVAFQLMFAIITVALISGAVADRLKFGGWLVFAGLWATFVYFPVAHWVFAFDGVTGETRRLDCQQAQGDRLRRWYRGAHQLGYRGSGAWRSSSASGSGWPRLADAAAQPAVRDARCGPAVVRLVRLQRRFGDQLRRHSPARRSSPRPSPPRPRCWRGCSPSASATARPPRWVRRRASSPGLVAITPSCSSVNVGRRAGDRFGRRRAVRAGGRPEIQAGL